MTPRIFIIAGSDSGGGAGIQADIKTVTMFGGFAMTAITAITAQNSCGVQAAEAVSPTMIAAQIDAVLEDFGTDAIKIGMLGDVATINVVAERLRSHALDVPIILDPVMQAKGGASLLADDAIDALCEHLAPLATLLTPNIPEAQALTGLALDEEWSLQQGLDRMTLGLGVDAVLLKGGHAQGDDITDIYYDCVNLQHFSHKRIASRHTHGTGCTMASALATMLAQSVSIGEAIPRAQEFIRHAITHAPGFGAGHGPMKHNFML